MNRRHYHPHYHHHEHQHDSYESFAVIKNRKSGLVLDASQYEVKLQRYTGLPAQLWRKETIPGGKFIIINKANGKVLDIQGGASKSANLITYASHGGANQQWFINPDHTIVCASGNLAVDIYEGRLTAGNRIIAYPKHGNENQQFYFE